MKILHFADAHIGVTTHSYQQLGRNPFPSRVMDQLARLTEVMGYAQKSKPDLILFAGDLFDSPSPSNALRRTVAELCCNIADIAPFVILLGNHDTMRKASGSPFGVYDLFDHPNLHIAETYDIVRIDGVDALIATAPYPREWLVAPDLKMKGAERHAAIVERTHELIADLADRTRDLLNPPWWTPPRILLGHFSVTNAFWAGGGQADPNNEVIVDSDTLFEQGWDYVALGHIHRHQHVLTPADRFTQSNIVYSGSPSRIGFNEEDEDKGFVILNAKAGNTTWVFVPLTEAREMTTLDFECDPGENPTEAVLNWLHEQVPFESAIVRLRIKMPLEVSDTFHAGVVQETAEQLGASKVVIQRNTLASGQDDPGANGGLETLSSEALLRLYLDRKGFEPDHRDKLVGIAEQFMEDQT